MRMSKSPLPLFDHWLKQPSVFTPEALIGAVRDERGLPEEQFDKGDAELGYKIFKAICRAGRRALISLGRESDACAV